MNTHELKHMALVAEWKEKVAACRGSGQTVKSWCEEQGISSKKYYYWERAVLAEAEKQLVPMKSGGRPNFVAVPASPEQRTPEKEQTALAAKVRMGDVEVEIYGGAEAGIIELLLRALKMLNDFKCGCPVYMACGYTDLRRGIDGLAGIVQQQFHLDPYQRALFLFCGRRKDRIKGLYWEEDGFLLLYKRLEAGQFRWPRDGEEAKQISAQQYRWLMEGLEIEQAKANRPVTGLSAV